MHLIRARNLNSPGFFCCDVEVNPNLFQLVQIDLKATVLSPDNQNRHRLHKDLRLGTIPFETQNPGLPKEVKSTYKPMTVLLSIEEKMNPYTPGKSQVRKSIRNFASLRKTFS